MYDTILFQNEGKISYCKINKLSIDYYIYLSSLESKEAIRNYLNFWLKEIKYTNNIKIIGLLDKNIVSDEIDYDIIIDEDKKILKIGNNSFIFDDHYNNFILNNSLWNGNDYEDDENKFSDKLNLDSKIIKIKYDDSCNKIKFLNNICKINKNNEFYNNKLLTQVFRKFKYTDNNYKKIKSNLVGTYYNFKIKNLGEDRQVDYYLTIKYRTEDPDCLVEIFVKRRFYDDGYDFEILESYQEEEITFSNNFPKMKTLVKDFINKEIIDPIYNICYFKGQLNF